MKSLQYVCSWIWQHRLIYSHSVRKCPQRISNQKNNGRSLPVICGTVGCSFVVVFIHTSRAWALRIKKHGLAKSKAFERNSNLFYLFSLSNHSETHNIDNRHIYFSLGSMKSRFLKMCSCVIWIDTYQEAIQMYEYLIIIQCHLALTNIFFYIA